MAVDYSRVYNLKQARDRLGRFIKTVESKSYQIVLEEAARANAEAKVETPIETGKLRDSVTFSVTGKRDILVKATASALDNGYDYSKIQHDNTKYHHPRGGKAHYISDPFTRMVNRLSRRLKDDIKYER